MKRKWGIALLLLMLGSMGCSLLSAAVDNVANQSAEEDDYLPSYDGLEEFTQWPAYLPVDIPVLDGDINMVFGSADTRDKVRIFFESLSEKEIEQYVELCMENGFEVEYIVFTREGFEDNSAEQIKAGDFDAVEFSRGDILRMRLEYGSTTATLDIYR